jgi:hypothetical protein
MYIAASEGLLLQRRKLPNFTGLLSHCLIELVSLFVEYNICY